MRSLRPTDQRVPKARRLRRDSTDVERKLWQRLRGLRTEDSHFRRQATIGPYIVDFACHGKRLAIELDGGQHGEAVQAARDAKRDEYLRASGYRVLRFWNNDVMANIDGVLQVIAEAVSAAAPPNPDPSPPLRGGRGESRHLRRKVSHA
ncbi:MAG: endonuclease domain-containing protein [Xanthobacteraceae bacterium]|nr:endonuclease domain-containing protein [Xanthobacteraceae bacterium]